MEDTMQTELDKEQIERLHNFIWGNDPTNHCGRTSCGSCIECKDWNELTDWIDKLKEGAE
jgi:hypothetical protein